MKRRLPRFPTRYAAYLAGGLLLGAALTPVAAQQSGAAEGQVVVRSDGAVYLIANGQRRWVATVQINDDELNAYPEAEPLFTALSPIGAASSSQPAATSPGAVASPGSGAAPAPTRAPATPAPASAPPVAGSSGDVPIELDIAGPAKLEAGERLVVSVKTTTSASCSLTVKWPNGTEVDQGSKTPDSRGHCRYSIEIPKTTPAGMGLLKGTVKESGKSGAGEIEFEVLPTN